MIGVFRCAGCCSPVLMTSEQNALEQYYLL